MDNEETTTEQATTADENPTEGPESPAPAESGVQEPEDPRIAEGDPNGVIHKTPEDPEPAGVEDLVGDPGNQAASDPADSDGGSPDSEPGPGPVPVEPAQDHTAAEGWCRIHDRPIYGLATTCGGGPGACERIDNPHRA